MKYFQVIISPPEHHNYERAQRATFLHYVLLIIIIGLGLLALLNQSVGAMVLSIVMFFGIFIIFGLVVLNKRGYYKATGVALLAFLYALMTFNLVDGLGLHDPGILAFPAFILISAYLFGCGRLAEPADIPPRVDFPSP